MEPGEYGNPGMADHSNTLYGGIINDKMALISEGRRPSPNSSPKRENNLNSVVNSHDRSGDMVKFNLNNNHDQNNSNALVPTGQSTKRSSLAMSVLEIVEKRKNSKQDQEVSVLLNVKYRVISYIPISNAQGLDPESLMFRDGRRKIDMVLCYEEEDEGVMTEVEAKRRENRAAFIESLVKEGLELEIEDKSQSFDEKTCFIKIHMPWKTETRYSEVLNLKLPIKRFITISVKAWV